MLEGELEGADRQLRNDFKEGKGGDCQNALSLSIFNITSNTIGVTALVLSPGVNRSTMSMHCLTCHLRTTGCFISLFHNHPDQ